MSVEQPLVLPWWSCVTLAMLHIRNNSFIFCTMLEARSEKSTIHTAPALQGLPHGWRKRFFVKVWSTGPKVAGKTIGAKPNLYWEAIEPFTKPPLLQESRLTGGGSPNLKVLVEWKVPVEGFMGAANCFHWIHPWLYTYAAQTAD